MPVQVLEEVLLDSGNLFRQLPRLAGSRSAVLSQRRTIHRWHL